MNKAFSKKEKFIYAMCLLSGVTLLIWSSWRNSSCGYDCGLFTINAGPAVIVSLLFSLFLVGGSLGLLLVIYIFRNYINDK